MRARPEVAGGEVEGHVPRRLLEQLLSLLLQDLLDAGVIQLGHVANEGAILLGSSIPTGVWGDMCRNKGDYARVT